HEHVPLTERQATAALEDREQDRQAAVVESRGHPLWGAEAALRRQRLDLDQQRTRPFHQRGDRGAGNTGGASRQKRRGWVRHGLESRTGHLEDRKSTRLNSSHVAISYAVFCLKKKKKKNTYN